ncbi:MAG: DUF2520 domain-containing protein [Deltaproteobacteria bacterium]|nr:MAG: DUF2520 domain-containing protein [Deltaproteobacteria bacterium]
MSDSIPASKPLSPSPLPLTYLLGAGRLGTALAQSFLTQGLPLLGLWNRKPPQNQHTSLSYSLGPLPVALLKKADLLLLTVSDAAIPQLAQRLLEQQAVRPGQVILHCSGRSPSRVLQPLAQAGCDIGRMHPLQPVTQNPPEGQLFKGAAVGVEGTDTAVALATQLAEMLGGSIFSLQGTNPALYHAAAVMASNYVVSLSHLACQLMEASGVQAEPLPLLLPLMKLAVNNLEQQGLPEALTGPISRGDLPTIEEHVQALREHRPDLLPLYTQLAQATVSLAQEQAHNDSEAPVWQELQSLLLQNGTPT